MLGQRVQHLRSINIHRERNRVSTTATRLVWIARDAYMVEDANPVLTLIVCGAIWVRIQGKRDSILVSLVTRETVALRASKLPEVVAADMLLSVLSASSRDGRCGNRLIRMKASEMTRCCIAHNCSYDPAAPRLPISESVSTINRTASWLAHFSTASEGARHGRSIDRGVSLQKKFYDTRIESKLAGKTA